MKVVDSEQVIGSLVPIHSDTSAWHEPIYVVDHATDMTTMDARAYVEDLETRGLVMRCATVADGRPFRSTYSWVRVERK
jgi:hypothetical protein